MSRLPEETLRELRERLDIVDLIGRHLELKRSGKQYKGLCPFHSERTPSFYVDPQRKSYKCFGCGEWGDAIDFVCKTEGKSFNEAVYDLAARSGVHLPDRGRHRAQDHKRTESDSAFAINRHAAELYRKILLESPLGQAARDYQKTRNISDELSQRFELGYAPAPSEGGWDTLTRSLSTAGHSLELAASLGLVVKSDRNDRYFDRFRGRWMFPILLPGSSVAGFSGRILPELSTESDGTPAAKYINSPESILYKKSELLYGLHAASRGIRAQSRVILVEGNVDVVAMHRAGYEETLAPLGTALTPIQCQRIRRLSSTVVLCFDGDRAGQAAAWKALPLLLEQEIDPRVAALPPGQDPDSIDPETLQSLLSQPRPAVEWFLRRIVARGGLESLEARNKAIRAIVDVLVRVPNDDTREDYAHLAATMLDVPAARLWRQLEQQRPRKTPRRTPKKPFPEGNSRYPKFSPRRPDAASGRSWNANSGAKQRQGTFQSRYPPRPSNAPRLAPDPRNSNFAAPPPDLWGDAPIDSMQEEHVEPPFEGGGWDDLAPGPASDRTTSSPRDPYPTQSAVQPTAAQSAHPGLRPPSRPGGSISPIPAAQRELVALLVDRPEIARIAERGGLLSVIEDTRLRPIAQKVLKAALEGESQPSEGELLELIEARWHRDLHEGVFVGNYLEIEDPRTVLDEGLRRCQRDQLDRRIAEIDARTAQARDLGDQDTVRKLQLEKIELRRQQAQLRFSTPAV